MIRDPDRMIDALLVTPIVSGGKDWSGVDCWGVVELWFLHVHGIEIADRMDIAPGPDGIATGYGARSVWREADEPREHDLIVMRSVVAPRRVVRHGHCGVMTHRGVLHAIANTPRIDPFPALARRVTCILRHEAL